MKAPRVFKTDAALKKWLQDTYQDDNIDKTLLADGLSEAFLGVKDPSGKKLCYTAVYSRERAIRVFHERDGMTYMDAVEHFDFNVECAHVGPYTPIWIDTP